VVSVLKLEDHEVAYVGAHAIWGKGFSCKHLETMRLVQKVIWNAHSVSNCRCNT
jgi:hypothetical protein